VLADGEPVRACSLPISAAAGLDIVTIEGLARDDGSLDELQQAWIDLDVAQCGYCQAGQIMSAKALLQTRPTPSDSEIDEALSGNLCRCGTYVRIRKAIQLAASRGAPAQKSRDGRADSKGGRS
jgi:isoquinoline 1-oxidoreductase alpha subunit